MIVRARYGETPYYLANPNGPQPGGHYEVIDGVNTWVGDEMEIIGTPVNLGISLGMVFGLAALVYFMNR